MISPALERFISQAAARGAASRPTLPTAYSPSHPLMFDLLDRPARFLAAATLPHATPRSYARNLVYDAPDDSLSLYSIVWLPGQWTPVHDHGSWGVVGVIEGVLEERSYVRLSPDRGADADIDLARGGTVLLRQGAVTSFVPNPDHIHVTGVPAERPRPSSLHLYGRMMSDFNIYDVGARTRRRINVAHNES